MYCKNCKTDFEGNYCSNCGQKAVRSRPVLKSIVKDIVANYVTLEKGLFYLIIELFKRPGQLVADYISGERKKFFNPVKFIFIAVTLVTVITIKYQLLGPKGGVMDTEPSFDLPDYYNEYNLFVYRFFNIIRLLSVPIMSAVTFWLFKKSGYSYTENIILNCFVLGQRIIIFILFTPLYILFREHWELVGGLFQLTAVSYTVWAYIQFFRPVNKLWGGIKSVFSYLLIEVLNQFISTGIFYFFFYKQ